MSEKLASTVVSAADGRVPVVMCVQATRLPEAIALAQHAEKIGAEYIQIAMTGPASVRREILTCSSRPQVQPMHVAADLTLLCC